MAKVTFETMKEGDARLERILIDPVPKPMLDMIRSQKKAKAEAAKNPTPAASPTRQ